MTEQLKAAWSSGRPTINGWLSIGNAFTAEIMAQQAYDSLCIDLQHGMLDFTAMLAMLQSVQSSGVPMLVRVPWLEPGIIMKALDAGADGIICPMVNTAAEAAQFVRFLRYPPDGERSYGPTRAALRRGTDYAGTANRDLLAFAMIETRDGLANLDAIAATPGLDGVYVGPSDLSYSMSEGRLVPGFDREEADIIAAIQQIAAACRRTGKIAALHCGTPAYAARAAQWGYNMLTVSGDFRLLAAAANQSVKTFRSLTVPPEG